MPITIACQCGHRETYADQRTGETVKCPQCGEESYLSNVGDVKRFSLATVMAEMVPEPPGPPRRSIPYRALWFRVVLITGVCVLIIGIFFLTRSGKPGSAASQRPSSKGPAEAPKATSTEELLRKFRDPAERKAAAAALVASSDPAAVDGLAREIRDEDPEIAQAAAATLGEMGPRAEAALPVLEQAHRQSVKFERTLLPTAILRIRNSTSKEALIKVLNTDQDPRMKETAIDLLVQANQLSDPTVKIALTAAQKDRDKNVQAKAKAALKKK